MQSIVVLSAARGWTRVRFQVYKTFFGLEYRLLKSVSSATAHGS